MSSRLRSMGILAGLVLVVALASGGCRSAPVTRYYLLELPGASSGAATRASEPVRVRLVELEVAAPYDRDGIAYRPEGRGAEIGFYRYHRWAVPVEQTVREALAESLGRRDGIAVVDDTGDADVVLSGRVLRLEEVDSEDSIAAEVEVRFEWRAAGEGGTAASETVEASVPVTTRTVTAVVESLTEALDRAVGEIVPKLTAAGS